MKYLTIATLYLSIIMIGIGNIQIGDTSNSNKERIIELEKKVKADSIVLDSLEQRIYKIECYIYD